MVAARDHESRAKWQSKYFSQPTQPHLIDYVRFQIFDILSLLLFEEYATVQHYGYVDLSNPITPTSAGFPPFAKNNRNITS